MVHIIDGVPLRPFKLQSCHLAVYSMYMRHKFSILQSIHLLLSVPFFRYSCSSLSLYRAVWLILYYPKCNRHYFNPHVNSHILYIDGWCHLQIDFSNLFMHFNVVIFIKVRFPLFLLDLRQNLILYMTKLPHLFFEFSTMVCFVFREKYFSCSIPFHCEKKCFPIIETQVSGIQSICSFNSNNNQSIEMHSTK